MSTNQCLVAHLYFQQFWMEIQMNGIHQTAVQGICKIDIFYTSDFRGLLGLFRSLNAL